MRAELWLDSGRYVWCRAEATSKSAALKAAALHLNLRQRRNGEGDTTSRAAALKAAALHLNLRQRRNGEGDATSKAAALKAAALHLNLYRPFDGA
jgi:hypothetical protein